MRRTVIFGAAALAAAAVAATSLAAGSRPTRLQGNLTIYSEQTQSSLVDSDGNKKPSAGDMAITAWDDYNHEGGTKVGSGTSVCTLVTPPDHFSCVGSDSVNGSTIMEQCEITGPVVCAIVGGTGRFRNARGQVAAKPLDTGGTKLLVTFRLLGA